MSNGFPTSKPISSGKATEFDRNSMRYQVLISCTGCLNPQRFAQQIIQVCGWGALLYLLPTTDHAGRWLGSSLNKGRNRVFCGLGQLTTPRPKSVFRGKAINIDL